MPLTTKRVTETQMQQYFDRFTKLFLRDPSRDEVDVEILHPTFGHQYETHSSRLCGITYDVDVKELDVIFENGEHHVFMARNLWVAEEEDGFIAAIQLNRSDDVVEIIKLHRKALLALPRARDARGESGSENKE
jgi:uncharacterized protein DUF5335